MRINIQARCVEEIYVDSAYDGIVIVMKPGSVEPIDGIKFRRVFVEPGATVTIHSTHVEIESDLG